MHGQWYKSYSVDINISIKTVKISEEGSFWLTIIRLFILFTHLEHSR